MVQSRQVLHTPGFVQDEKAEEDGAAPLCWRQPGQVQLSPHPHVDGNAVPMTDPPPPVLSIEHFDGAENAAAASTARS